MTADLLVNSVYPISYFTLPGVDQPQYPDTFWWSSSDRYAATDPDGFSYLAINDGGFATSEILEIDLGRIREVNFINFDIIRAPVDVRIEYDEISTPERDAIWLPVTPVTGLNFDNYTTFDSSNRTAWQNLEFNFSTEKGDMIHTRYMRFIFTRRDEAWPASTSTPFTWPVFVKHLRMGRYISTLRDAVGPLLTQDTPTDIVAVELPTLISPGSHEARQRFVCPANSERVGVTPNMIGFGVLVQTTVVSVENDDSDNTSIEPAMNWSIWDVTSPSAPVLLRNGVERGVTTPGLSWLDFYLDDKYIIEGDLDKVYELRISSADLFAVNTVFTHDPNTLSNKAIPGVLDFNNASTSVGTSVDTRSVVAVNDYIVRTDQPDIVYRVNAVSAVAITLSSAYTGVTTVNSTGAILYPYSSYDTGTDTYVLDGSKNLVMRVWADVADEGRDVLGNTYRYVTHRERAKFVRDGTKAGWMSEPVPTPDAVESLYFDIRGRDENDDFITTLVEAMSIAPRTPGVRMNVYWSQQNVAGDRPETTTEWDYILWTPIQETYVLRRDEVIEFPQPIKAAFIKLEFTALNPLPFRVPTFPALPPRLYRRYPTWVEDQFNNSKIRATVDDWFLHNSTPVQVKVLATLANPIREFEYKQKEFLAALALGKIKTDQLITSGIVDIKDKALLDPVTSSKVYIQGTDQFESSLLVSVDQDSILGRLVVNRFDPNILTDPVEVPSNAAFDGVGNVSTINDRVSQSYQTLAQVPMRFNRTSRHVYTYEQAEFNKKAYFVGIDEVRFLRNDYTVTRDDILISDILHDDEMLEENTWEKVGLTGIPDGIALYVSYSVNPDTVDEEVFLAGSVPVPLSVTGAPARNVVVYDSPNNQGLQYFQGDDYDLTFGKNPSGELVNYISRSSWAERLASPLQDTTYIDAAIVIGQGVVPLPPTYDAGTVTGIGVAITDENEGPFIPNYGTGIYGGGVYEAMTSAYAETATVIGDGTPSGVTDVLSVDSGTVIGDGVPTAVEVFIDV